MAAQKITNSGFLNEFQRRHNQMQDRPFCWILGSGSSVQSGIPTGKSLAYQWLKELHELEDFDSRPIEEWANADNLNIPAFDFERAADFYPWIYQRRFRDYKEQGYAFLENVMDSAEPSFGYSVLAQIMALTSHKVAVTTNFDNLVADALSIYTRTFPLVCGHESLTGYIRPNLRRPLVAKIHRDLLLAPLSNPEEIAKLPGEWASALTKIFDRFTPIVIGYGGNDGSLMGFLNTLNPIEGGMFWCSPEGSEIDAKIHDVVEQHHGRLVPIAGFDEVMLQIQEKLQLPFLLPELQKMHDTRASAYQTQFTDLTARLRKPAATPAAEEARKPARRAAEAAVDRLTKEKNWWAWDLKATAETNPDKQEAIYRAGLEDFPASSELRGNFAVFQEKVRQNFDEAKRLYREAFELSPEDALTIGNFAWSLHAYEKEHDKAEQFYRKSLEAEPNATIAINFASLLTSVRQDYEEAEKYYRLAFQLDPSGSSATYLANFLKSYRKDFQEAEQLFRTAVEIDPNNADCLCYLAQLLMEVHEDYDQAEKLFKRALALSDNNFALVANYAQCLGILDRRDEALDLAIRAWDLIPKIPNSNTAESAFIRWLLERTAGAEGTAGLGFLKEIIHTGFDRARWSFEKYLATLSPHLPEAERSLAYKLADAILDESKVQPLEEDALWNAATPTPLTASWPT